MSVGRKPKPTHIKLVSGNPGKRKLNRQEPKPTGHLYVPPSWMNLTQQDSWNYAITHAPPGLLKKLDASALSIWVVAEVIHREASQQLSQDGFLISSPNTGVLMQSPLLAIINKQALIMLRAASELGFTPSARSRVVLNEEPVTDDPWAILAAQ